MRTSPNNAFHLTITIPPFPGGQSTRFFFKSISFESRLLGFADFQLPCYTSVFEASSSLCQPQFPHLANEGVSGICLTQLL